ncbi:GNAT family N-acetyltransferase [Nakamurella sp. GG22]
MSRDGIGVVALERVAARGWQGTSTAVLGDWLLRAGAGFTGRANSVLPLGSPRCSLPVALRQVGAFYAEHGLPALVQLPECDETAELQGFLDDEGWSVFNPSLVLTAECRMAAERCPPADGRPSASFADRPSEEWLAGYVYRGQPLPPSAVAVLENAESVVFGSLEHSGGQAAVVRGVLTDGWLGVTALTVDESRRRSGAGRHLTGELLRWAAARGARDCYLQVAAENEAALALYGRLGFTEHHRYHYRRSPGADGMRPSSKQVRVPVWQATPV